MKKRNKHNLSHYRLSTFNPGELIPVGCVEVLPGDTFDHTASVLLRCSPLAAPIMHRAMVRVHHFYVPNRITWPVNEDGGWEGFLTQQSDGDLGVPSILLEKDSSETTRLYEHLGCPVNSLPGPGLGNIQVSELPGRAYRAIWNEWYRDKDLQEAIPLSLTEDSTTGILPVCWRKDMFTAARTSPQFGSDVTIEIPLATTAPVVVDRVAVASTGTQYGDIQQKDGFGGIPGVLQVPTAQAVNGSDPIVELQGSASLVAASLGLSVDEFRNAMALQRYAERLGQFGHDYPSVLLSGYGVKSSDGRLQRPEYLGGGKTMLQFSEVLQTSNGASGPDDVVGSMYGHGIAPSRTRTYRRFFEEHGYVISCVSLVPEAVYATAVPRHFFKGFSGGLPQSVEKLIDDFYQPELERIGQQPLFKKELYPVGDGAVGDDTVFGYNDRYYEYRHQPSQVAGDFVPGRALDYWTWARSFTAQPSLNSTFVTCSPSNRVFMDQSGTDLLWCAVNHRLRARRVVGTKTIGRIF